MASTRPRCDVEPARLAALWQPISAATDKNFVKYIETSDVTKGKLDSKLLLQNVAVMHVLHDIDPKLNFKKSTLAAALKLLLNDRAQDWKLEEKHFDDWIETMTNRMANMCRHTKQGELKSPTTDWVKALPWRSWTFGWNVELKQAWRLAPGETKPEAAVKVFKEEGQKSHENVWAEFPDGHREQVAGITCEMYDTLDSGTRALGGGVFWEGEHSVSHNRLQVRLRKDRKYLMSLFEQGKQALQFTVCTFGPEQEEATIQKAVEVCTIIAEEYAADKIKKDSFKDRRAELISEHGVQKQPAAGTARKRPAAATPPAPPAKRTSTASAAATCAPSTSTAKEAGVDDGKDAAEVMAEEEEEEAEKEESEEDEKEDEEEADEQAEEEQAEEEAEEEAEADEGEKEVEGPPSMKKPSEAMRQPMKTAMKKTVAAVSVPAAPSMTASPSTVASTSPPPPLSWLEQAALILME